MNANYLFIIILAIVVGIVLLYNGLTKVLDTKIREEEPPKFEEQNINISEEEINPAPKKTYKRKYKKKPIDGNKKQSRPKSE
jgi:hypothetical protein